MITTKADKLLRSLIDAGLSLTEFTILATKMLQIQHDFDIDNKDRRQRDRLRQQDKLREQYQFDQQLKEGEQRRIQGLNKLRELGYVTDDNTYQILDNKKTDKLLLLPYSKEINNMKQKQRDCCLTFNIDYDLRLNQQTLERACRRAKRNIYELRAERFNRPESRSVLSVETITLHNKLKESIREINRIFNETKFDQDKRSLEELLPNINQYEGDIDLLMCQMQYEPKVKETILFSPVTTDILDRMNFILHHVRILANKISTNDYSDENLLEDIQNNSSNLPTKITYIIKIKTNDEISSSLSDETNVTIKLYGTYNKSPDIRLIQSINKTKWQSGQIDLFNIELNYLGDLYAIEIWHDSQYSSWKVDWIEIIDDGANVYRFPLDRLFEKYSDKKKARFIIQHDVGPVNRLPTKPVKQIKSYKQIGFSTYTVQVKTGKQPNKVTDSSIFIQLKGENGNFADNLCSANSAFKSSVFEPDQLDTFYLVWPYLSKINSLHLLVQSEGIQPSWFCEYITVEDGQTGEKYKFIVNQLFDGSNPDDPNLKRHLTVYPENTNQKDEKEEKEKLGYLMKIKTGDKGLSNMSTLPSINLILKGEKGKSEPYTLKSVDNKRKFFQENQTDEFIVPLKSDIGSIKNLQLSSNDQLDQWFIENIIMRDMAQGKDYIFPVYKWFNKPDGTNHLTVQPLNERKPDYKVYTRTIASELKGPDRSIKLLVQGNKGKQEIELNNPITMYNTFQPGHKDEYYLENMKSLGDLQSIQVDITNPNIKKLGLDYIEIKDLTTNDSYRFNINRMLDSKNPKMTAKAELIPRSTLNPISSKTNSNQLTLPNSTSTMANKKNFDQLTTNVPQGAKRRDNGSNVSVSTGGTNEENQLTDNSTENSSIKNNFKIKIKTMNKEFLDKDTKLQIELIDENDQSIINQPEKNLQQGKIDTFTIDTTKDFGQLKTVKISLIGSKLKKKNLYQPEFIEIFHPNSNKTYRLDYTKDDFLNSNKNQLELTKSIKLLSDLNIREQTQPQGTASSATTPYPKLTENILSENDEENISLPNQTITSSTSQNLSKEINSSRQIRPGDRVKNNRQRQLITHQSKPSLHEADWYRRSIETNKDHRDELKQIQLISNKHFSKTKFDHQQANLIKNKYDDNQKINRQISNDKKINLLPKQSSSRSLKQQQTAKIISKSSTNNQQYSNEIMNEKTRTNSNRSEENQTITKREKFLSAQQLPIKQNLNSDHHIQENYPIAVEEQQKITKDGSKQITPLTKQISIDDQRQISQTIQINDTDIPKDTMVVIKTPTSSNISELSKPSTTTVEQSTISSKTSHLVSQKEQSHDRTPIESNSITTRSRIENRDTSYTNKQRIETPSTLSISSKNDQNIITSNTDNQLSNQSISVPPKSRTPSDIPKRRSQSASSSRTPSNVSSTISKDQSQQLINISSPSPKSNQISHTTNPSAAESHLSQLTSQPTKNSTRTENLSNQLSKTSPSNKIPTDSSSISTKQQQPQLHITDSTFNEYNSQPNIQNISAVTIHTIATKSDSDLNSTRKSMNNDESEHSLESKSLLSPTMAKKSGKNSRQNTSTKTQNKQPSIVSPDTSIINKSDNPISSTNNKYLSKETSDIQNAPRPASHKSHSENIPLAIELKTSDTINESAEENQDPILKQYQSYNDEPVIQKPSNVQSATRSTPSQGTKSQQLSVISSQSASKSSLNKSITTGKSSISTITTQNQRLPNQQSDIEHSITLKKKSINSNLPNKQTEIDHMSTVYEESEPSTISIPNVVTTSLSEYESKQENTQDWLDTNSTLSSSQQNIPLNQPKSSSKEKSPYPSNHHRKTIDATSILTPIKSNPSTNCEFRVQTGNESQLDGTNERVSIEIIDIKGELLTIPLTNSINNSKPFQKGQLDIFRFNIPNTFHDIEKIHMFLRKTAKDPLHISYCELQYRQTMTTHYFPVEKWLGENNVYKIEIYSNNSLF